MLTEMCSMSVTHTKGVSMSAKCDNLPGLVQQTLQKITETHFANMVLIPNFKSFKDNR